MSSDSGENKTVVGLVDRLDEGNLSKSQITVKVQEAFFPDEPKRRVAAIVDGALNRSQSHRQTPNTTQPKSINSTSPEGPPRRLAVRDIEYLSDREFGRLLRLAFRQFGGSVTVDSGSVREGVTTLSWSREAESTLSVVLAREADQQLSKRQVAGIAELLSEEASSETRLALVTNLDVSEQVIETAVDKGLTVCDYQHLDGLLALARLPPKAYGDALESGENPTFDWDTLVNDLPEPPMSLSSLDPFDAADVQERTGLAVLSDGQEQSPSSQESDVEEVSEETATVEGDETSGDKQAVSVRDWIEASGDTVSVDEGALGELQSADTADADSSIDSLVDNLED